MIVIGSQALRIELEKIGRDLPSRKGRRDLDILANAYEAAQFIRDNRSDLTHVKGSLVGGKVLYQHRDGTMIEIELSKLGSSTHVYLMWAEMFTSLSKAIFYGHEMEVASLEMLYSLKRSHRHSPRGFEKHVVDLNLLHEILGEDKLAKVTKIRYQETQERLRLKTPSLNKTVTEFFDDKVSNRTFVHDQIHEVMAHYDEPLFEKIRESKETVKCSKEKWEKLPFAMKYRCVQEEAYVIALERAVIPMLFEGGPIASPKKAYEWAVMRICTTLCSGWFREWALENYSTILAVYDEFYVQKFLGAVEQGRIKRIENESPEEQATRKSEAVM